MKGTRFDCFLKKYLKDWIVHEIVWETRPYFLTKSMAYWFPVNSPSQSVDCWSESWPFVYTGGFLWSCNSCQVSKKWYDGRLRNTIDTFDCPAMVCPLGPFTSVEESPQFLLHICDGHFHGLIQLHVKFGGTLFADKPIYWGYTAGYFASATILIVPI